MANTIKYKELRARYLDDADAIDSARRFFGDRQPAIHQTGFYSAPSWNWGYIIGIVKVDTTTLPPTEQVKLDDALYFEVVTQFGQVRAARRIYIPEVKAQ